MSCNHRAMTPTWTLDGLCYQCKLCHIQVTLTYEALGRMVTRRLKKRGMTTVIVKEFPIGEPTQGAGERAGDEGRDAGEGEGPRREAPARKRRILHLPE